MLKIGNYQKYRSNLFHVLTSFKRFPTQLKFRKTSVIFIPFQFQSDYSTVLWKLMFHNCCNTFSFLWNISICLVLWQLSVECRWKWKWTRWSMFCEVKLQWIFSRHYKIRIQAEFCTTISWQHNNNSKLRKNIS